MIGISSCLGGVCCRYDGQAKEIQTLKQLVLEDKARVICPEVLGGLPIPREPAEIVGGDGFSVWEGQACVRTIHGKEVTELFKQGAIAAYQKLVEADISSIIVKENSPSCGCNSIYNGTFSGVKMTGVGVATAYFLLQGIQVVSEKDWTSFLANEME